MSQYEMTQEELLEWCWANDPFMTSKEDILSGLRSYITLVEQGKATSGPGGHLQAKYLDLLKRFYQMISDTNLFSPLEDYWYFTVRVAERGARLNIEFLEGVDCEGYDEDGNPTDIMYIRGCPLTLIELTANMLTAEEFAALYDVSVVTVRQWIRRGKIRSAVKNGNTWMISELAQIEGRGYSEASYHWKYKLYGLPRDYEFLNETESRGVRICQNEQQKDMFDIFLSGEYKTPRIRMNTKEKEKFELFLLSNPLIECTNVKDWLNFI